MIPPRNAGLGLAVLAIALAACTRSPAGAPPAGSPGVPAAEPSSAAPEPRRPERPSPPGVPGPRSAPAVPGTEALRAAAPDRLIGSRPLERLLPSHFTLGPLEDLSGSDPGPRAEAAAAARKFLEGILAGRVDGAVPDARDVIEFMVGDLLEPDSRPLGWRLGRGIPRPEGGWIFPILLSTGTGGIFGEVFAAETPGPGWGLDLVILNREPESAAPGQSPGAFDPTIRTVKPTGR